MCQQDDYTSSELHIDMTTPKKEGVFFSSSSILSLVGSAHICLHQILLKNPLTSFGLKPKSKQAIGKKKYFLFFG